MFTGKSVRRRAASMEAAKLEKRRGRFKKNIENVKNGTIGSEFTAVNIHEICNIFIKMSKFLLFRFIGNERSCIA